MFARMTGLMFSEQVRQGVGVRRVVATTFSILSSFARVFAMVLDPCRSWTARRVSAADFESEPRRPIVTISAVREAAGFALDSTWSSLPSRMRRCGSRSCAVVVLAIAGMVGSPLRADVLNGPLTSEEAAEAISNNTCTAYATDLYANDPHFDVPVNFLVCHRGRMGDATYAFDGSVFQFISAIASTENTGVALVSDTSATGVQEAPARADPPALVVADPPDSSLITGLRSGLSTMSGTREVIVPIAVAAAALFIAASFSRAFVRNAAHRRECEVKERLAKEKLRAEQEAEWNRAEHERRVFAAAQQEAREDRERAARAMSLDGAVDNLEAQVAAFIQSLCRDVRAESGGALQHRDDHEHTRNAGPVADDERTRRGTRDSDASTGASHATGL